MAEDLSEKKRLQVIKSKDWKTLGKNVLDHVRALLAAAHFGTVRDVQLPRGHSPESIAGDAICNAIASWRPDTGVPFEAYLRLCTRWRFGEVMTHISVNCEVAGEDVVAKLRPADGHDVGAPDNDPGIPPYRRGGAWNDADVAHPSAEAVFIDRESSQRQIGSVRRAASSSAPVANLLQAAELDALKPRHIASALGAPVSRVRNWLKWVRKNRLRLFATVDPLRREK